MWKDKHITFFITGGIATYKVVELIRLVQKQGAQVRVAMTNTAMKFVGKATFQTISQHPVQTGLFEQVTSAPVAHVELADWTDIAIVAPATANIMSKMANGLADDFVSTTLLALTAPIFVIPAMNVHMWQSSAVQRNIKILKVDGVNVMDPDEGLLAEGYSGKGRFPENTTVMQYIEKKITVKNYSNLASLKNKKILITAGGTREYLDPVRYISNRSSGKMGYAFAEDAQTAGAEVTLISATKQLATPNGVKVIYVETVTEMMTAVHNNFDKADILIMAAAVSDYQPVQFENHKIKKATQSDKLILELQETPDILKSLKNLHTNQFVVGFAAETEDLLNNAKGKLRAKGADMIVANDVSRHDIGFDVDENAVTILQPNEPNIQISKENKKVIAKKVLEVIAKRFA